MQDIRLDSSVGFALTLAFRQVNRAINRAMSPLGLSAEQAHILIVLLLEGPMKIGELQRLLMLGSGTLSGAIDRMEKAGLVRRVADPDDGRTWRVVPASVEVERQDEIVSALEGVEASAFAMLSERERRDLGRLLHKVSGALATGAR